MTNANNRPKPGGSDAVLWRWPYSWPPEPPSNTILAPAPPWATKPREQWTCADWAEHVDFLNAKAAKIAESLVAANAALEAANSKLSRRKKPRDTDWMILRREAEEELKKHLGRQLTILDTHSLPEPPGPGRPRKNAEAAIAVAAHQVRLELEASQDKMVTNDVALAEWFHRNGRRKTLALARNKSDEVKSILSFMKKIKKRGPDIG